MARFPFSKSRKKAPPQLVLAEPMSKAHKILGSTPMSIDSPKPWDDASSGFSGGTGASTVPSYISTEDGSSDHQVAIAPSDDDWANESDILPAILEANGLDSDTDKSFSDMTRSLRKTQSSSTIRSWYDKSKQPIAITQQTSALAMCKGVPSKVHHMLDLESPTDPRMIKKPPVLDFSNLRAASRLSRKGTSQLRTDGTLADDLDSGGRSPSMLHFLPSTGKGRRIQKRSTKDSLLSPTVAEERPRTAGSGQRRGSSTREIPSLYDHYEQMTLRQLMHSENAEKRNEEEEDLMVEEEDRPLQSQTSNQDSYQALGGSPEVFWMNDSVPTTPQTPFTTGLTPAAAQQRSNSVASKLTTGSRRSKSSNPVERPNLKETSMLMLSDSEDDPETTPSQKLQKSLTRDSISSQHTSTASLSPRTVSRSQSSRAPSQASEHRPIRNSKRASFASANTYITIPSNSRLSTDTAIRVPVDSRSSTPYTDSGPSCRASLMSNLSSPSVFQNSNNYIQEATAVIMVAGRRPSRVEYGEDDTPETTASPSASLPQISTTQPSLPPSLSQTAPEQLTPPLSPTSVDFYIQSARSSIDGTGSQNRYMAVTRQEEMLLSALRQKKKQHNKKKSVGMTEDRPRNLTQESLNETEEDEESAKGRPPETMFDFGFPAPPTARKPSHVDNAINTSASMSSLASTTTTDRISQDSLYGDHENVADTRVSSLAPAPSNQPPLKGILKRPSLQHQEPEQQDVLLFLDNLEPEPSPDMTDFSEFGYLGMPSLQSEHSDPLGSNSPLRYSTPSQIFASSSKPVSDGKRVDRSYRSPSAMASVPEDGELEHQEKDIPRPDSPISPDAFPAVPQIRTTLSSMARLSAVGPAPMINEPGWWGDDD
ncbi:hypothetical protein NQ176_g4525 [Zarea fungicola]|uniref:Uncharacterized protein n=1 Tax=Zarea fungicola TaxID=93591 RepID=A0ACC1NCX2_9HYPO|nr:hypothetical protein NQ176_g4525 [Lecanicillium fungicola]